MLKLIVNCSNCNKILYKQLRDKRNKNHFCNRVCKNEWQKSQKLTYNTKKKISKKLRGKNNPMYGKNHTEEIRKKLSEQKKEFFKNKPDKKFECGNSRLSKKEKFEIIQKGHKKRSPESYSHELSEEAKLKIGESSKAKFTKEFKFHIRKIMEERGLWIPLKEKEDFLFYKEIANWKKRMWDLISDKDQIDLLNELGIFNPIKNSGGVVRDHKYSRFYGWKNEVFPEILRHPVNCEIIKHSDNVRKKGGWKNDENSISLKDLFTLIKVYNKNWHEQNRCLVLIEKYDSGERYNKLNYIKNYYE